MALRPRNKALENSFARSAKARHSRIRRMWTGQDVLALLGGVLSLAIALWLTFSGGLGLAILFWIAAWLLLRSLSRRSWGVLDRFLPEPMTPEEEAAARERMRRADEEDEGWQTFIGNRPGSLSIANPWRDDE